MGAVLSSREEHGEWRRVTKLVLKYNSLGNKFLSDHSDTQMNSAITSPETPVIDRRKETASSIKAKASVCKTIDST